MVADCNIPSESILMVTFSNAAAKEMRERYQKSYGKDDVTFSTIHSLCFAILRKFAGYSNEDILTDARDYFYKKLRGNKQVNDKEEFINSILTEISVIKNNQIPLDDYNPICCNDKTLFEDLFTGYEEYKNDLNVVDFDDMLIQAYQTMKDNKNCLPILSMDVKNRSKSYTRIKQEEGKEQSLSNFAPVVLFLSFLHHPSWLSRLQLRALLEKKIFLLSN